MGDGTNVYNSRIPINTNKVVDLNCEHSVDSFIENDETRSSPVIKVLYTDCLRNQTDK